MIHPLQGLSQTRGRSVAGDGFEIQDENQIEPLNKRVIKKEIICAVVPEVFRSPPLYFTRSMRYINSTCSTCSTHLQL